MEALDRRKDGRTDIQTYKLTIKLKLNVSFFCIKNYKNKLKECQEIDKKK